MTPAMSVVLVTDVMNTVEGVISAFRHQTIADRLELVLAAKPTATVPDDVGSGFAACTVLRVEDPFETASARAACVRAATAPVVAIGETHCLPEPDWCELLLAEFDDPAVAIAGSRVLCGNPETSISQAAHLLDYGVWAHGPSGPRDHMPTHNVAVRRDLLLALGDGLAGGLSVNRGLDDEFLAEGRVLQYVEGARAHHLNVSLFGTWFKERLFNGRTYGGQTGARWPWPRRVAYGLGWPLIAVVRFVRLAKLRRAVGTSARAMPTAAFALVVASAGEGLGFLTGAAGSPRYRRRMEIEKGSHLRSGEASAALARVLALDERP